MVFAAASLSHIKQDKVTVWIGLYFTSGFPTHCPCWHLNELWCGQWKKYKVVAFSDHFIFRRSPSLLGSETEKLNQLNVWKIAMAICQDSKVYISRIYWVLLFWRREMAASFRQTALSAMTGDGWMLIWIILKVESDTFWLLWFSKILTEMPTKMGITFSFTFKLCHGGPPEAGLPLTPAHHTIWPLVRDNWINLAGLVSKYWACFKRYLCPHRGLFPNFIFIRCYLAKKPPSPTRTLILC